MALSLPVPHVTARRAAFLLLNAYLIDLTQRMVALGGGTMIAQLPVVDSDVGIWANKLVAYLTELEGRVSGIVTGGDIFIQDADPGAVGANSVWIDFANDRFGLRDPTNTLWNFFSINGGVGQIGSSGYGIGGYGNVPWDETVVNSSVFSTTPSLGLLKPMYATVGWGTALNTDMDKAEALNVRLLALEAAIP